MKIFVALLLIAVVCLAESATLQKRQVDSDALKTALLVDVTKLIAEASRLQTTLKDKGLLAEAVALEAAIIAVKEVETQLVNLHPTDVVGQILLVAAEATLQEVEKKLATEVKRLEALGTKSSRKRRDVDSDALKTALLVDVTKLIAEAERLSTTLKDKGQLAEAVALEAAIIAVKEVETQLINVHPTDVVGQVLLVAVEAALKQVETKLAQQVAKLEAGAPKTKRDTKSDLINTAEKLVVDALATSALLKGKGRAKEAIELEAEIAALEVAATALKSLSPSGILEELALLAAEQALKAEETKLQSKLTTLKASLA